MCVCVCVRGPRNTEKKLDFSCACSAKIIINRRLATAMPQAYTYIFTYFYEAQARFFASQPCTPYAFPILIPPPLHSSSYEQSLPVCFLCAPHKLHRWVTMTSKRIWNRVLLVVQARLMQCKYTLRCCRKRGKSLSSLLLRLLPTICVKGSLRSLYIE